MRARRKQQTEEEGEQDQESSEKNVKGVQMPGTNAEITTTTPVTDAPTFTAKSPATISEGSSSSSSSSSSSYHNFDILNDYY